MWDVPLLTAFSCTLIQAFISSPDLSAKSEMDKLASLLPEEKWGHHSFPYLACSSSVRCFPETRKV